MSEPQPPASEAAGLPPVVPPSGRMIAQLFVVPGAIVAGAVVILLGFSWLAGGPRTPDGFLDGLKNANPEVRWRSASDLAQVLQRDDELAADPKFGLALVSLLNDTLAEVKKPAPQKPIDVPADTRRDVAHKRHEFEVHRSEVQYLTACVGNLSLPVGAKVLADMVAAPVSPDPKTDALIRRQATWALATLGNNRQRFDRLSATQKKEITAQLEKLASGVGDSADWARATNEAMEGKASLGVIAALAKCAQADDPFLRKQAALALSFWQGTNDENKLADATLLKLTRDSGQGVSVAITEKD